VNQFTQVQVNPAGMQGNWEHVQALVPEHMQDNPAVVGGKWSRWPILGHLLQLRKLQVEGQNCHVAKMEFYLTSAQNEQKFTAEKANYDLEWL